MYVIIYDFGTTSVKTCLLDIGKTIRLICDTTEYYRLYILSNGGAEQDADEWWNAIISSTRRLFTKTDISPSEVGSISFCTQMQGVVLVDKEGNALRRPMSYADQRAVKEFRSCLGNGLIKISGCNAFKQIGRAHV